MTSFSWCSSCFACPDVVVGYLSEYLLVLYDDHDDDDEERPTSRSESLTFCIWIQSNCFSVCLLQRPICLQSWGREFYAGFYAGFYDSFYAKKWCRMWVVFLSGKITLFNVYFGRWRCFLTLILWSPDLFHPFCLSWKIVWGKENDVRFRMNSLTVSSHVHVFGKHRSMLIPW